MNKYFKDINTIEELRNQYKELLKKFHPDNIGGSTEVTQSINMEYDHLFKTLKNFHNINSESQNRSTYDEMKYDYTEDKILRDMLDKIIIFPDLDIEIIGCWIWVGGNTILYKKELKSFEFRWAHTKKKWYYHTETFRKKSYKNLSMDDIRNYYGSSDIKIKSRNFIEEQ